jgi:hypothetical protein
MSTEPIDLVFSFDTTGSMYPCLTQVRRTVEATTKRLFQDIPNLRVGIISHGDYCDGRDVMAKLDLTDDQNKICRFIREAPATGGGDAPECYELVLHEARSFSWRSGRTKVLVMIGDDVPHGPSYRMNTKKLDWRNELGLLLESNINVYAVQALARRHATTFWKECAQITGGYHLELNQFADVTNLVLAVAYKQKGSDDFIAFEKEVQKRGGMNRHMHRAFATLGDRAYTPADYAPARTRASVGGEELRPVHPARFQVIHVDGDATIRDFVEDQGLQFRTGRGFYEFTKSVKVQANKEVVLQDKNTGDFFTGRQARLLLGLPDGVEARIKPDVMRSIKDQYRAFIQSNSYNRRLLGGTTFLYEVSDWDRMAA